MWLYYVDEVWFFDDDDDWWRGWWWWMVINTNDAWPLNCCEYFTYNSNPIIVSQGEEELLFLFLCAGIRFEVFHLSFHWSLIHFFHQLFIHSILDENSHLRDHGNISLTAVEECCVMRHVYLLGHFWQYTTALYIVGALSLQTSIYLWRYWWTQLIL